MFKVLIFLAQNSWCIQLYSKKETFMKKISRLISVIHRHGMRFFDWSLADTEIGPGQQFFLVCIYENPGISMQKLAKIGHFG